MTIESAADPRVLVLASGSPRRRQLLRGLGLDPRVRPVDIDETPEPDEQAVAYVLRLAAAKARARAAENGDDGGRELILAADTVVAVDGDLLGKPADARDARDMLRRLSGRGHQVSTGVAVLDPGADRLLTAVETTEVVFAELSDREIAWYVASGEPMDKAGAYAVQGLAALFVERLEGNYSNVVGLPLPAVYRLLRRHGFSVVPGSGNPTTE
ncbi:MAG: Maf family protein [Holophagales bacterium]|nr:Maf family protein [Holophagales bacterium]